MSNDQHMRDFAAWSKSLRNFDWLKDAVPGATDIDIFVERRGKFLILETKAYSPNGVKVPFGQYLALKALADLNEFDVWLVGETADPDKFYWLDLGSRVPTKVRTAPVWFKARQFSRTSKSGLAELAKGWFSEASGN